MNQMLKEDLIIAPSILTADYANLEKIVKPIEAETKWLHLDVMDGHFVPNISFGPHFIKCLRRISNLFFDVHLMIEEPGKYLEALKTSGSDLVSIHIESKDPIMAINLAKSLDMKVGVAINPETEIDRVFDLIPEVDLILVMTVHPGFGGQRLIQDCLRKIADLTDYMDEIGQSIPIEVDGGINLDTIGLTRNAGASIFVAGSFVYNWNDNPVKKLRSLKHALRIA